jgi:CheY-like chemotaxis protein
MKVTQSGSITVFLESSPTVNGISLKIVDTGPGIEPSFASKLFQPFSKANSFNPGAGLGLYITKALVDRMSGNVSLYSTPGEKGSTFEVKLPVALAKPFEVGTKPSKTVREVIDMDTERYRRRDPEAKTFDTSHGAEKHAKSPATATSIADRAISPTNITADTETTVTADTDKQNGHTKYESSASHSPLRILIADDNEISRKILLALLRKMSKIIDIETAQAVDGLQAVAVFETFHPQLVLTDVSMPFMTGTEAAVEMRKMERAEQRPKCGIFAITGLGSSDPRLKVEALREDVVDGWLVKGKDSLAKIREIVTDAEARHRQSENCSIVDFN